MFERPLEAANDSCELEDKLFQELHRDRENSGIAGQECIDQLHRRISDLENKLRKLIYIINRDYLKGKDDDDDYEINDKKV